MATPGVKQFLAASIVNAVIFEFLVDIPLEFVVRNTGPWASSAGIAGTLLFIAACVVCAFPDEVRCIITNIDSLFGAVCELMRYLLPWLALKLLWTPCCFLLCLLTFKLFSERCHRLQFLNIAQLVFGGFCLYLALHRTGLTDDIERRLGCWWRRTLIYRLYDRCCCYCVQPRANDNVAVQVIVRDTTTTTGCRNRSRARQSRSSKGGGRRKSQRRKSQSRATPRRKSATKNSRRC